VIGAHLSHASLVSSESAREERLEGVLRSNEAQPDKYKSPMKYCTPAAMVFHGAAGVGKKVTLRAADCGGQNVCS
jgi:hypothetical protein